MREPVYQLFNVSKVYDHRTVLQIDMLEIQRGEILALVGPSGAGKSTLLRLLNFLEPASSGSIIFLDHRLVNGTQPELALRRQVTTVFQRPVLLNRTVEANVAFGLKLRGQRDTHQKVAEVLQMVGLEHMARRRACTLSSGEAQRVALARAIVIHPQVLLLDEPTANLDPYNIGLIEEIIRRLNVMHGITVVFVTHDVFQAKRLAHRAGLLLAGRIVELADVTSFFEAPCDPRTRAFLRGELVY